VIADRRVSAHTGVRQTPCKREIYSFSATKHLPCSPEPTISRFGALCTHTREPVAGATRAVSRARISRSKRCVYRALITLMRVYKARVRAPTHQTNNNQAAFSECLSARRDRDCMRRALNL
jgi:hypothetical protein